MNLKMARILLRPGALNPQREMPFYGHRSFFRSCQTKAKEDSRGPVLKYLAKVMDNPLPLGVGALVVGILQWKRIRSRNEHDSESAGNVCTQPEAIEVDNWTVTVYKSLPLRYISRLWGYINEFTLPMATRNKILGAYSRTFGCNIEEAEEEDLQKYESLGQFFRRKLKANARPVCSVSELVSPCDGRVLYFSELSPETSTLQHVKGLTFTLQTFLGPNFFSPNQVEVSPSSGGHESKDVELTSNKANQGSDQSTANDVVLLDKSDELELSSKRGNRLFCCVLYLAPGDYHRFHSPTDWTVLSRRHFPGELLSVNPSIVQFIPNLFQVNERVAYLGKWKHGFFSMTAVGATNVGSIKIGFDPDLATNERKWEADTFYQKSFKDDPVNLARGDYVGEFNLGSSIVLVFEAPADFTFDFNVGDKVQVGAGVTKLCSADS